MIVMLDEIVEKTKLRIDEEKKIKIGRAHV